MKNKYYFTIYGRPFHHQVVVNSAENIMNVVILAVMNCTSKIITFIFFHSMEKIYYKFVILSVYGTVKITIIVKLSI